MNIAHLTQELIKAKLDKKKGLWGIAPDATSERIGPQGAQSCLR